MVLLRQGSNQPVECQDLSLELASVCFRGGNAIKEYVSQCVSLFPCASIPVFMYSISRCQVNRLPACVTLLQMLIGIPFVQSCLVFPPFTLTNTIYFHFFRWMICSLSGCHHVKLSGEWLMMKLSAGAITQFIAEQLDYTSAW